MPSIVSHTLCMHVKNATRMQLYNIQKAPCRSTLSININEVVHNQKKKEKCQMSNNTEFQRSFSEFIRTQNACTPPCTLR
eukprot:TRINITY_DN1215_c0_g1_i1.p2 TRINITY_DN1215_c0_g1~~TRINITY_DN1215_c0_g1_i1.p2  ORF type:complete len:80 (-),score=9.82 TRINITY_DN1215_c0_g1_i1:2-241(-)